MSLDLTPIETSIARLEEALEVYARDPSQALIRDGLIQRFEFTYEVAHKTLKRALELTSASPEQYDTMTFADLVRSGNEQDLLLGAWPQWRAYRDMRARTSHTYNEQVALDVVGGIAAFLPEAAHLRDRLRARGI